MELPRQILKVGAELRVPHSLSKPAYSSRLLEAFHFCFMQGQYAEAGKVELMSGSDGPVRFQPDEQHPASEKEGTLLGVLTAAFSSGGFDPLWRRN